MTTAVITQNSPVENAGLGVIDISGTKRTPFERLVSVEVRKTYDTAAGRWLLITIGILTTVVMGIALAVSTVQNIDMNYGTFIATTAYTTSILLPILGILVVTSEWGQRTAMVSFTLEPSRGRVIGAKLAAGLILALGAALYAVVTGAVANLIYAGIEGVPASWEFGAPMFFGFLGVQTLGMITGFGLATLLLSTPAAIVVYFVYSFVLPALFAIGAQFLSWFADVAKWIDFGGAQAPLAAGTMHGADWAHLAVAGVIWLVLPLVIGLWRVLRAEVK